jgi:hypothetical protein
VTDVCELTRVGEQRLNAWPLSGPLAVACVRNEAVRLPRILAYHRRLGVDRLLVVDNASVDGTAELLDAEADVIRFPGVRQFCGQRLGVEWTNEVTRKYGFGHWIPTARRSGRLSGRPTRGCNAGAAA